MIQSHLKVRVVCLPRLNMSLTILDPSPAPITDQRLRDNPGGFTQFLFMVMGFEVLLQHRTMGEMEQRERLGEKKHVLTRKSRSR
jgi:hypothetical protein